MTPTSLEGIGELVLCMQGLSYRGDIEKQMRWLRGPYGVLYQDLRSTAMAGKQTEGYCRDDD